MAKVLALANQKGGVGKTTSAINIACELANLGFKALIIDFDPQGSASSGIGIEVAEDEQDLFDVFLGEASLVDIIKPTAIPNLSIAPASKDLVSIELELGKTPGRELILKSEVANLLKSFDFILIDCPPSSGLLTLNALGAADQVLIPLQAEYYALEGLSALMETIKFVESTFNNKLSIMGVFLTMYDMRTNLSEQVWQEAKSFFGKKLFASKIPRNIKLSEAPSYAQPVSVYAPESAGAKAYRLLAAEVADRSNAFKDQSERAVSR